MEPTQLDRIEAKLDQLLAKPAPRAASAAPVGDIAPAPDSDLDGEHGDQVIKFDPKQWKGQSYVGKRMSQTTPEYCDSVLGLAMWKLRKDIEAGDEKKAGYARRDASRALGWKLRLEAGYKPPQTAASFDDDPPF
jgi:hypothetical protein